MSTVEWSHFSLISYKVREISLFSPLDVLAQVIVSMVGEKSIGVNP